MDTQQTVETPFHNYFTLKTNPMIDQDDPRLTSYVLGELSAAEAAEIEQAIQDSPELEAAVEEIRSTVGLLGDAYLGCLLYTSPSPRDLSTSRMPSSA